jgi:CRP/FNR family transcriptional regulator
MAELNLRLVEALKSLPYFDTATDAQLELLSDHAQRRTFTAHEIIFLEGAPSAGMWLIETGRIKVYKVNPAGEEHILRLLGAGDTFNDIPALDSGPNAANTAALSDSVIWLLPSAVLQHLLQTDNTLALKVIKILTGRVRSLVSQIEDLALYSVTIRLARFLLKQAEDPALSGPGVTRATIAAHLATTPETISRALRSLEQAQAIRFDRHRILIEREDLLRAIATL